MAGDTFLEAAHRKSKLLKGYPLAGRDQPASDQDLREMGITGDPMYLVTNPIVKAVRRLHETVSGTIDDKTKKMKTQTTQDQNAIRVRQEAERRGAD